MRAIRPVKILESLAGPHSTGTRLLHSGEPFPPTPRGLASFGAGFAGFTDSRILPVPDHCPGRSSGLPSGKLSSSQDRPGPAASPCEAFPCDFRPRPLPFVLAVCGAADPLVDRYGPGPKPVEGELPHVRLDRAEGCPARPARSTRRDNREARRRFSTGPKAPSGSSSGGYLLFSDVAHEHGVPLEGGGRSRAPFSSQAATPARSAGAASLGRMASRSTSAAGSSSASMVTGGWPVWQTTASRS